ncbi:MAG: hypothetical protein QXH24_00115 [Candidatus Bathyarchaeia archaeon]
MQEIIIPLIATLLYFFISLTAIGIYVNRKYIRKSIDYTVASRTMPWWLVMFGAILLPFGVGNSLALSESSWIWGSGVLWWMIVGSGLTLVAAFVGYGRWARRLGAETPHEAAGKVFDDRFRILSSAAVTVTTIAIASLEMFACSSIFYALLGLPIEYCVIIAFCLYALYVILGGMLQYSILNFINIFVVYAGLAVGMWQINSWLGPVGGIAGVSSYIEETMGPWSLHIAPPEMLAPLFACLVIPILLAHTCAVVPICTQPVLGARSEKEVVKGWLPALLLNGFWGYSWTVVGLIAISVPLFLYGPLSGLISMLRAAGTAGAVPATLFSLVSAGVPAVTGFFIALMAATISTGGILAITGSTWISVDIVKPFIKPNISDKGLLRLLRALTLCILAISMLGAVIRPFLMGGFIYIFSFSIPVFLVTLYGLGWRRNSTAAATTVIIAWIVSILWVLFGPAIMATLPVWLHPPLGIVYPQSIVSVILYPILTLISRRGR